MKDMPRRDFLIHSAAATGALGVAQRAVGAEAEKPTLRKALQLGMLPKKLSNADKFKLARACGFEGIEGGPIADLDAAKKHGDLAREAGTPIHSIVFGGWHAPFSSPDPAVIEEGLEGMRTALHSAKAQGADTVLLVPAHVKDDVTHEQAYERSQTHIPKLLDLAEELDIIIAVENVWNNFLLKPDLFAQYVDEFKNPWLQAYFDVGNVVKYADPQDWIRVLGKRIVKVHLKDFRRKGAKWTPLREGDVDWPEVRKAFADIKYSGYVTPELRGGDEAYLRDLSNRIDLFIAGK